MSSQNPGVFRVQVFDPKSDLSISSSNVQSSQAEKTRVLVVSGTLSGGGAERFASTLLQHLDPQRFQPSLCLFRDEIAFPIPQHVNVSILGHTGPLTTGRTVKRLARTIDRIGSDVVLSTMDYLGMFLGEALRRTRSQPYWIARTSNNPEFQFGSLRGHYRKAWLSRVYPNADVFVANSMALAESFQRVFPCAADRTEVVLNPLDINRIQSLSEAEWPEVIDTSVPNLVASARLMPHKRADVLLEAFQLVLQHSPARLWICGEGPYRSKIEKIIEKRCLRPFVRIVGFRENTFPLLRKASIAVATSDYEGLPNTLLEAQALGIPVVSTRSAFGPEEIIEDGVTGMLAERGNANDVARGILRLLNDAELHARISRTSKEAVTKRFGLDRTIPAWESMLIGKRDESETTVRRAA